MTKEHSLSIEDAIKLGIKCHAQGQFEEAYKIYQAILQKEPRNLQTLHMLGVLAMQTGNSATAKIIFNQVLEIDPKYIHARYHLGIIQREAEESQDAITTFEKVLELNSNHIDAQYEIGICLQKLNRTNDAISHYKKTLELNPNHFLAAGQLITLYMHTCRWAELAQFTPTMDRLNMQAIKQNILPGEVLSTNIARIDNPAVNLKLAQAHSKWIKNKITSRINFDFKSRKIPNKKLTIAYLCNNFNNHPTGHLICRLFAMHNREHFNIIAYSYGKPDDEYYPIIKSGCDKFVNIILMTDAQVATEIYNDNVDILIDLKGHTPGARLEIFAYRPAPIQITYLGFPGTSGADFFDYVITDKIVTPPEQAANYSEKFFYMPDCYQVNDSKQCIAEKKYTRAEMGLPETGFIFASFNQSYKIDPLMFDVWCRLLDKVPGSVLWLLKNNADAAEVLKQEAKKHGINPERLVFAELFNNKAEHLARVALADLALDTRICGGHTTSSDMLWAGVPVVTMLGKHFASRVCSSLLNAIGMPELIVTDLEAYENLCLSLAQNPEKLSELKQKLLLNRNTKPLYDTDKFLRHLEKGYLEVWDRYVFGKDLDEAVEC